MHKHAANFIISALSLQSCADLNESFLTLQHQILLLCRIFNSPELYWFTKGIVWLWQSATLLPVPELNGNMEHFLFHRWRCSSQKVADLMQVTLDSRTLWWGSVIYIRCLVEVLRMVYFLHGSKVQTTNLWKRTGPKKPKFDPVAANTRDHTPLLRRTLKWLWHSFQSES